MDEAARTRASQPDTDLRLNKPRGLQSTSTATRVADIGCRVDAVARTLETMLGGRSGHPLQARRRAVRRHRADRAATAPRRADIERHLTCAADGGDDGAAVATWSTCARR